jgi:acyl-CoA thioester hydrolase
MAHARRFRADCRHMKTMQQPRPARGRRTDYLRFVAVSTRWHDNDVFGHVNNVVYYAFFDTAVNSLLIDFGLDPLHGSVIGLVVETHCSYFASLAFPDPVEVGVRVDHVGRSSVRYGLAVFTADVEAAMAQGAFTHVYVDRASRRPVDLPAGLRQALASLQP